MAMTPRMRLLGYAGLLLVAGYGISHMRKTAPQVSAIATLQRAAAIDSPVSNQGVSAELPEHLARVTLEQATRDPFFNPPVVTAVKPAPIVAPVVVAPPVPVPTAPPLNLRYAGRMTGPDGVQTIYASFGETPVVLTASQTLPNGYRVVAIKERVVEFTYPPLNTSAKLDLPEPPRYEIR